MKCEIEFQKYKYFVLERVDQLAHHGKPAFAALLEAAARSHHQTIYVSGKRIDIDGAILIWGCATPEGRKAVIEAKGFHDVLTIEQICTDLQSWRHQGYFDLLADRRKWCLELFSGLLDGHSRTGTTDGQLAPSLPAKLPSSDSRNSVARRPVSKTSPEAPRKPSL
jgi:hypothetical protein